MIITLFLNLINFLLLGIAALLPTGTIPTSWVSSVFSIWSFGNAFSYVFPVSTLLSALGVVLAFEVAVLTFKLFNWAIRKIPGVS